MWKRLSKQLFLQEAVGAGVSRAELGDLAGSRATDCSDETASPAHPWHVCGMEGAQWVGQLACIPGHLALPLSFPPTAFLQLDRTVNSCQAALLDLMSLLISWGLMEGWVGNSFPDWSLGAN